MGKVHYRNISMDFFGDKLQIFLKIISESRHQNMFVGIFYSSGIHPFHVVVINQRAQNWLYPRTSAFSEETGVIWIAVEFFVHFIIKWFVDRSIDLFKFCCFTTAFCSQRTIFTIALAATIMVGRITFRIYFDLFKEKKSLMTAFFYTFIPILFFVKNKAFPRWFVLTKGRNLGINAFLFAILQSLATAVTCIG